MLKVKVIDYHDIWGNTKDGFEVNGTYTICDDLFIENNNEDIVLKGLKDIGFLQKHVRRNMLYMDYQEDAIELYEKKNMFPLGRVEIIKEVV